MIRHHRQVFRPLVEGFESRALLSTFSPTIGMLKAPVTIDAGSIREGAGDFDRSRFPNEREKLTARDYPNLGRQYEVLAPSSDRYNCIAHSLGLHDRWISPQTGPARNPFAWTDK